MGMQVVQSFWSGYGQIVWCLFVGVVLLSVIVKYVCWFDVWNYFCGWNLDFLYECKLQFYCVEMNWYECYVGCCFIVCCVLYCLGVEIGDEEVVMVMEDFDVFGFDD